MEIFDYDNILLLPRKCRVESRSECDAGVELGKLEVIKVGSLNRLYGGPYASRAEAAEAMRAVGGSAGSVLTVTGS